MGTGRTATVDGLSEAQAAQVADLVRAVTAADGVKPLSEAAILRAVRRHPGARHVLAPSPAGDRLLGYAQVDPADPGGATAELAVVPDARRQGLGRDLVTAAEAAADELAGGRLQVWAHGELPAGVALASRLGYTRTRTLWRMERPAAAGPLPEPHLPDGVTVRAFEPGRDEDAWLRVNARAFAHHPEQGRTSRADLLDREAEPWFDPAGFLLAERAGGENGELAGFHWTKVEDGTGEVYVLGVDPGEQGSGLGKALLLAGLAYLRDRGADPVELYVEDGSAPALGLYEKLGFVKAATDAQYTRPAPSSAT